MNVVIPAIANVTVMIQNIRLTVSLWDIDFVSCLFDFIRDRSVNSVVVSETVIGRKRFSNLHEYVSTNANASFGLFVLE